MIRLLIAALMIVGLTSACTPLGAAMGAAATAGGAAAQERGIGGTFDDESIEALISHELFQFNIDLFNALTVEVYEGRALLMGYVPAPQWRHDAVRLTWKVEGVKEVINEIEIGDNPSFSQVADDVIIANSVRGRLLMNGDVNAINYNIEVVNGTVYMIGVAQNTAELEIALDDIKNTSGAHTVKNYMRIKSGHGPAPLE